MPDEFNTEFYPCPCCDHRTVAKRFVFDICPICGWEDDWDQSDLSANHMSIEKARSIVKLQGTLYDPPYQPVTPEQFDLAVDMGLVWVGRENSEFGCVGDWMQQVRRAIPPH